MPTASAGIRKTADGLYPDNSGQMIDGMHGMYMRDAIAVMDQSDLYQAMSSVVDEVAQLIYHAGRSSMRSTGLRTKRSSSSKRLLLAAASARPCD